MRARTGHVHLTDADLFARSRSASCPRRSGARTIVRSRSGSSSSSRSSRTRCSARSKFGSAVAEPALERHRLAVVARARVERCRPVRAADFHRLEHVLFADAELGRRARRSSAVASSRCERSLIALPSRRCSSCGRRGTRIDHVRSRKCRFSSPSTVAVANVENSRPRSGSKRSTALSMPRYATCRRSSNGSPRFANRRARCDASDRCASISSLRSLRSLRPLVLDELLPQPCALLRGEAHAVAVGTRRDAREPDRAVLGALRSHSSTTAARIWAVRSSTRDFGLGRVPGALRLRCAGCRRARRTGRRGRHRRPIRRPSWRARRRRRVGLRSPRRRSRAGSRRRTP